MADDAKVVIIGGGFGGLRVARGLKKHAGEVLLLDRSNHHLFQPFLYRLAGAQLAPIEISMPIREVLSRQKNVVVVMGEVARINKERKSITMKSGKEVSYDYLVVAVGNIPCYFGRDDWSQHATGVKTLWDALTIRERLLLSFEMAESADSAKQAEKYLNFVVIGGGPGGVETAGAIAKIAQKTMIRDFRHVDVTKTNVYLVEAGPRLLPAFPEDLAERARQDLQEMGVKVRLDSRVMDISGQGVKIGDDHFIPSKNVIWVAGVHAAPLVHTLDVPLDGENRVIVQSDCSVPGYPEIFVIGDAAHFATPSGKVLPGLAPVALQQGKYVSRIIRKQIPVEQRPPFRYHDKGIISAIGTNRAVAVIGKMRLTGYLAWLAWGLVHIPSIVTYRSRLVVLIRWAFQCCTGLHNARIIQRAGCEDVECEIDPSKDQ